MKKKNKSVSILKEKGILYKISKNTITIPTEVFETAESKEEIEDWLLAQNPEFVKRMRKARTDNLAGKGKSLEIKRRIL